MWFSILGPPEVPLVTTAAGYLLEVDPERFDLHRFERSVEWARADLAAGRLDEAADGFREALAMYRSGRKADALQVYRHLRTLLVEELGLEPTAAVQELHRSILTADPILDRRPAPPATAVPAPPPSQLPPDASEVLGRFIRAFGVEGTDIPLDVQERAALLRSLLAERSALLILDNSSISVAFTRRR